MPTEFHWNFLALQKDREGWHRQMAKWGSTGKFGLLGKRLLSPPPPIWFNCLERGLIENCNNTKKKIFAKNGKNQFFLAQNFSRAAHFRPVYPILHLRRQKKYIPRPAALHRGGWNRAGGWTQMGSPPAYSEPRPVLKKPVTGTPSRRQRLQSCTATLGRRCRRRPLSRPIGVAERAARGSGRGSHVQGVPKQMLHLGVLKQTHPVWQSEFFDQK